MTDSEDPANADELPAAAVIVDGSVNVEALLADVVARQRARGRRVRGLLMTFPGIAAGCAGDMVLVDVETRDEYLVSLPAGSGSCRADTQGFASASRVLKRAQDEAPDFVVCNRFGGLEAEGKGFTAELLDLMASGIPLLTAVATRHVEAWQRFSGGARILPAQAGEVTRWLDRTLAARPAADRPLPPA